MENPVLSKVTITVRPKMPVMAEVTTVIRALTTERPMESRGTNTLSELMADDENHFSSAPFNDF